jgi:tetratricopeptide (TPR) repeat protein
MKAGADYLNGGSTADAVSEFKAAAALRPASVEALEALAGSYLKQQRPDLACPLYQKLVTAKAENPDAWYGLIKSHYDLGRAAEALRLLKTAPQSIRDQWTSNPERLVMISFLYADSGDQTQAQRVLLRARQLSGGRAADLPPDLQMQFAGLYLRLDRPRQAAEAFSQLTRMQPDRVEVWEGLLNSLLRSSDTSRAYQTLQEIPSATYKNALTRASFVRTVAALQEAMQRHDLSEVFLQKAIEIDRAHGKEPDAQTEIQLANTWKRANKVVEAERLLRQITEEHPESSDAWLTLISLLHSQKQDRSADAEMKLIPSDVLRRLRENAGFATVEAGVYSSLGRNDEALAMIRTAMLAAEGENRPVPMELHLQEAWILLNSNRDPRKLYSILERYGNAASLTATERSEFQSIWSIWSQREAAVMLRSGNAQQAVSILEAASQMLPQDPKIQGTLAGTYLQGGSAERAYSIYKQWGLKGGSADDFSGAVGSALTVGDSVSAERWLNRGLQRFPHSSRLLALRGKEAAEHGDYADAETYLREALAVLPPDQRNRSADRQLAEISSVGTSRNPV